MSDYSPYGAAEGLAAHKPMSVGRVNHMEDGLGSHAHPGQSGAAAAGTAIVRAFPFTFDTPNLLTGAALYTPTAGDVLLDTWFDVLEAWDGTTPQADVGSFQLDAFEVDGWFGRAGVVVDMSYASSTSTTNNLRIGGSGNDYRSILDQALLTANVGDGLLVVSGTDVNLADGGFTNTSRYLPAVFIDAVPVKVVVSTTGRTDGADPGSAQGAAVLYLVTATPAT